MSALAAHVTAMLACSRSDMARQLASLLRHSLPAISCRGKAASHIGTQPNNRTSILHKIPARALRCSPAHAAQVTECSKPAAITLPSHQEATYTRWGSDQSV